MQHGEITKVLENSAIFKGIGTQRLQDDFLPAMQLVHFKKQLENNGFLTDRYFYIVVKGMIHGYFSDSSGERRVSLYVLREGDGFDIITLLEGKGNMVSYSCLGKEADCLQVPLSKMREWAGQEPIIAKALMLYLSRLLVELEELVFDLSLCDTGTRLAKLLLRHAKTTLKKDHGTTVLHHLTHEELASLIGSVRVVVSRQFQKLKKMSLIEVEKGKIIIRDLKALVELIENRTGKIKKEKQDF